MSNKPSLYSYIRFSTSEQAKGHSLTRQLSYSKKVAEERGLTLDDSLSMEDLGVSAFKGDNITQGKFGGFLEAIKDGRVPSGSILLIESLDRLSRQGVMECSSIVTQIINAGITVITAIDNKEYNKESIDKNPFELFAMLMIFIRANEESETKSTRVTDVLIQQCEDWQSGKRGFRVKCGKAPNWVRWDDSTKKFVFKDREKQIMLRKIELYKKGYGGMKIAELINDEFGKGTVHHTGANVYKEVKRSSLLGQLEVTVRNRPYVLKDYYPRLVEQPEFDDLVNDSAKRGAIKHSQKFVGILGGIGVFKCGTCGKSVNSHVTYRQKESEAVPSGHKRYGCVEARRNNNCKMKTTIKLDVVEKAVVTFCQDQVNLKKLLLGNTDTGQLRSEEYELKQKLADNHSQTKNLVDALAKAEGGNPVAVINMISDLEQKAKAIEVEISENKKRQSKVNNLFRDEVSDRWLALTNNLATLDNEARLAIRPLVRDTFKSLTIQTEHCEPENLNGLDALVVTELMGEGNTESFDLTMEFHNGNKRLLRLNKHNGKLLKGFDI